MRTVVRRSFSRFLRALGGLSWWHWLAWLPSVWAPQSAVTLNCVAHIIFARNGGNVQLRYALLAPALTPADGALRAADKVL